MTKTQTAVLVAVISAAAIPLGVQQTRLTELRAELAHPPPPAREIVTSSIASSQRESEAEEIERLRKEIERLRARATSAGLEEKPAPERQQVGPTLLLPGRTVLLSDLVFAGNETPEATLQSILASARDGAVEVFFALDLNAPPEEERGMLATVDGREGLAEALREHVQALASVEVIGRNEISASRVQLLVREARRTGAETNTISFGRTSRGWKRIL